MTPKEAIELIKIARAEVEWEYPLDYAAAFDKAIEALQVVDALYNLSLENDMYFVSRKDLHPISFSYEGVEKI